MDVASNILMKQALSPATYTSDQTSPGSVDTQGYYNAALVANIGAVDEPNADETYDLEVYEADNSNMNSATKIVTLSIDPSNADNTVELVRLDQLQTTRQRYLEARLKTGGTSPSIDLGLILALGEATQRPVGNTVTDV